MIQQFTDKKIRIGDRGQIGVQKIFILASLVQHAPHSTLDHPVCGSGKTPDFPVIMGIKSTALQRGRGFNRAFDQIKKPLGHNERQMRATDAISPEFFCGPFGQGGFHKRKVTFII